MREANGKWLIDLLGIFVPDDEIFQRSYKYVPDRTESQLYLNNEDGFFDDLPKLSEKYIRKTNRLRLPKNIRCDLQLKKVKERMIQLAKMEQKLKKVLQKPDPLAQFAASSDEEEEEDDEYEFVDDDETDEEANE